MALTLAKETRETGEPDAVKVARPVRRGAGRKGGCADLARGLPYLVPRSGSWARLKPGVRLRAAGVGGMRVLRERRGVPVSGVWCVTRGRLGLGSPRGPGRAVVRSASPRCARAAEGAPAGPGGLGRLPRQSPAGCLDRVGSSACACPPWAPAGAGEGAVRRVRQCLARAPVQGATWRVVGQAGRWGRAGRVWCARAPVTVQASRVEGVAVGRACGAGRAPPRPGHRGAVGQPARFARRCRPSTQASPPRGPWRRCGGGVARRRAQVPARGPSQARRTVGQGVQASSGGGALRPGRGGASAPNNRLQATANSLRLVPRSGYWRRLKRSVRRQRRGGKNPSILRSQGVISHTL